MTKHRKTNLLRAPSTPIPLKSETDWFRDRLMEWWAENKRDFPWRHTRDEYRLAVTEILLQQTTAAAVAKVYDGFFARFPTWCALNDSSQDTVYDAISVLGLGRQRAKRLKDLSAWVAAHGWRLPSTRDELEEVPGIGQYVASVLLAVVHGEPEPMLDVNMARVLERYFGARELADIRDDPWLQVVSRRVVTNGASSWALLDLAATLCSARRKDCAACIMLTTCSSGVLLSETSAGCRRSD